MQSFEGHVGDVSGRPALRHRIGLGMGVGIIVAGGRLESGDHLEVLEGRFPREIAHGPDAEVSGVAGDLRERHVLQDHLLLVDLLGVGVALGVGAGPLFVTAHPPGHPGPDAPEWQVDGIALGDRAGLAQVSGLEPLLPPELGRIDRGIAVHLVLERDGLHALVPFHEEGRTAVLTIDDAVAFLDRYGPSAGGTAQADREIAHVTSSSLR